MKSGLLVGLSGLVCQILAQVNIPAVQDFDSSKFSGKWYLIAIVMDNIVTEDTAIVKVTAMPAMNQDILLSIVVSKDDTCVLEKVHLVQTQQPGVFKVTGAAKPDSCSAANQLGYPFETGCDVTVHMVEVDYDNHYILHFTTPNNHILHLYARRKKQVRQQKKQFKKVARSLKFDLKKMFFEPRNVKCSQVTEKN